MTLRRKRFVVTLGALLTLVVCVVCVDYLYGTDAYGATTRFMWQTLTYLVDLVVEFGRLLWYYLLRALGLIAEFLVYVWRVGLAAFERLLAYIVPLFFGRGTRIFTAVTLGGGVLYYFSRRNPHAGHSWWDTTKELLALACEPVRSWWHGTHIAAKCAVTASLIAVQVHLGWWLMLFPVAFVVPYLAMLWNMVNKWVLASAFERWYFARFRAWHWRILRWVRMHWLLGRPYKVVRLCTLYFRTGWRIWYYDPRFAFVGHSPTWVHTIGRLTFAWQTIGNGEWAKRRMHRSPLLRGVKNTGQRHD